MSEQITAPGIYPDLPNDVYHAQRDSLSSTGARRILETCPAKFRYGKSEHKPEFDLGTAAHKLILGDGPELLEVAAKDWRTKKAQEEQQQARAEGKVPLLSKDYAAVHAMADAIRKDPLATAALAEPGRVELSAFWRDETGVLLRCRPDLLTDRWVVDYKSTTDASKNGFAKSIYNFGYYIQASWYLAGLTALGLADEDTPFLFVAQEKAAPYLVTVHQLDDDAMRLGREKARRAIDLFAACLAADSWPGYASDVLLTSLPAYALKELEYAQ